MKTFLKNSLSSLTRYLVKQKAKQLTDFVLEKNQTFLVIAPHPDDEIIGLGGLILQAQKNNCPVHFIFLTDGEASAAHTQKTLIVNARKALTDNICKKNSISPQQVHRLGLADGQVPNQHQAGFENAVQAVLKIIKHIKPNVVFATHPLDYWPFDHVACAAITKEAVRQSALEINLYYYWVWSWYHLKPWQIGNIDFSSYYKLNITEHLVAKKILMNLYINPLSEEGKPWSGVLPKALIKGNTQGFELIEKIN